jgi:hypothetical protein
MNSSQNPRAVSIFGNNLLTLKEYLDILAEHSEPESSGTFAISRLTFLPENACFMRGSPSKAGQQLSVVWMEENFSIGSPTISICVKSDDGSTAWLGCWNPKTQQYNVSEISLRMEAPMCQPEADFFPHGINTDAAYSGPIWIHPTRKSPMMAYHNGVVSDEQTHLRLHFLEWVQRGDAPPTWVQCDDLDPIVVSLLKKAAASATA